MKKIQLIIICLILTLSKANAQEPQFKFHLAFEDATGAKDTLWIIWDSLATDGSDAIFDEIPLSLPTDTFQVYLKYNTTDSGKVKANPMSTQATGFYIKATNYVYPLTMTWDTSLIFNNNLPFTINTGILDNDWFFFNNNDPLLQAYNMLKSDSVDLPSFNWGSQEQFPINFSFGYDPFLNTGKANYYSDKAILFYPNPTSGRLLIHLSDKMPVNVKLKLMDIKGLVLKQVNINSNKTDINLNEHPSGFYIIEVYTEKFSYREKIIKY